MLHCSSKSTKINLMNILVKLNGNTNNRRVAIPNEDQVKFAILDRMSDVQLRLGLGLGFSQSGLKIAQNWLNTSATVFCGLTYWK